MGGGGIDKTLLLLSNDDSLVGVIRQQIAAPWSLVTESDGSALSNVFVHPNIRLIVIDDTEIPEENRGWLLNRIRRHAPGSSLIYIAGEHSETAEKLARVGGAQYYVSKPLSERLFGRVLQSFMAKLK